MRCQKWWWPIFLFALGAGATDAYLVYRSVCAAEGVVKKNVMSHREFLEELCDQLLEWMNQKYDGKRLPLRFYAQAYVSTFSLFVDAVRPHNTPLAELAVNTAMFRSF